MEITLPENQRAQAVQSLQRYFEENLSEPIGNLPAGQLLSFILKEIGPVIYNRAVSDVRERLQVRLEDIESELYQQEFSFWNTSTGVRRGKT